eukprot:PhF_6_TR37200/c0_g1_i2/m.54819/K15303/AKR7; aflatoxin B1 aldehyde reductase
MSRMQLVLGSMMIGGSCDAAASKELISIFRSTYAPGNPTPGTIRIDTARLYCGGNTETVLGDLGVGSDASVVVDTKVNPWTRDGVLDSTNCNLGLSPSNVEQQFEASLKALKATKVQILYLHAPDHTTPVEETLQAVDKLHKKGLFSELGLSNYSAWQVADIVHICRSNGYVPPTVYQGMYNALTRDIEVELLPACRKFGLRFFAYNPLAGGLLTGRHTAEASPPTDGRFAGDSAAARMYKARFWKPQYFDSIEAAKERCTTHNTTLPRAALRWLVHHSKLDPSKGDAVILGGSTPHHIKDNVEACLEGLLEKDICDAFEDGWSHIRGCCPQYFR